MALIVLDASVVVALYVEEPGSMPAQEALVAASAVGARLHAPDLLMVEVANALWKRVSRGELRSDDAVVAINDLSRLEDLTLHPLDGRLVSEGLALALVRHLTAYDATYVALAASLNGILVSTDRRLVSKANQGGLIAVAPGDLASHL